MATTDKVKAMTPAQLRQLIAERSGISVQQAKLVLETLFSITVEQTNNIGTFTIPSICKITKVQKPAKPERKMMSPLMKQEITVKAKPAYSTVKARPVKLLKDAVS